MIAIEQRQPLDRHLGGPHVDELRSDVHVQAGDVEARLARTPDRVHGIVGR